MNVKELLEGWLREHHYDGLYNSEVRCGCDVDDLNPCGDSVLECKPSYKTKCDPNCKSHCDSFGEDTMCYSTTKKD